MEIKQIPIGKIKRDRTQPRTYFDPVLLSELAQSIKTEGVINPVEVDKDLVIVTGEMRWRAAKLAGLETLPCKIIKIDPRTRYRRQVIENLHHNTMTDMDTAVAFKRLLDSRPPSQDKHKGGLPDQGVRELARELGKSQSFIMEKLGILSASYKFRKAVSKGLSASFLRAIKAAPQEFRGEMEDKIIKNGFASYSSARIVAQAIRQYPDKGKKLLSVDYSKLDTRQVSILVHKMLPEMVETPGAKAYELALIPSEEIADAIRKLQTVLDKYQIEDIGLFNLTRTVGNMRLLVKKMTVWLQRQPEVEMEKRKLT